jgi:hypothetical protein
MANENNTAAPGSADLHPGFTTQGAVTPPPEQSGQPGADRQMADNPRTRGHSPARDAREQQQDTVIESKVKFGDGTEYSESQVRDALAHQAEQEVRKRSLPPSPDKYEIKNTPNFKPPEGFKFEWDMNDPGIKAAREIAHARGLDQETFSSLLDVYAANKIGESQKLGTARAAELGKLGSAANQRIDAIETWLKSRIGAKAGLFVGQLRNFPVAAMVEGFEEIIRGASNQGGADFSQSGRQQQEPAPKVPAFDGTNFGQVRAAQDNLNARQGGRR